MYINLIQLHIHWMYLLHVAPRRRTKHIYKSDSSCCFVRPSLINASNLVTATLTLRCGEYLTKCGCTNCTHRFSDVFSMQTGPYINDFSTRTFYFQLFWQSTHKFSIYTALLSNVDISELKANLRPDWSEIPHMTHQIQFAYFPCSAELHQDFWPIIKEISLQLWPCQQC